MSASDERARGRPVRRRDDRRLQPLRRALGDALLEERLALRAVREALHEALAVRPRRGGTARRPIGSSAPGRASSPRARRRRPCPGSKPPRCGRRYRGSARPSPSRNRSRTPDIFRRCVANIPEGRDDEKRRRDRDRCRSDRRLDRLRAREAGLQDAEHRQLPAAGYGPTSNWCSIVRAHYSSWEGVAMAYEGSAYWQDWPNYLDFEDERGFAKYMDCGTVLLKSKTSHHEKVLEHYRDLGVEFEDWDDQTLAERVPCYDTHAFWPPQRPEDEAFWETPDEELPGAIFTPGSGYVNDPQLACTTSSARQRSRAASTSSLGGSWPSAATAVSGRDARRTARRSMPIVVNVAGPRCVRHQPDGGRRGRHEHPHARPPPRGAHRPGARRRRLQHAGHHTSDGDIGNILPPSPATTS